jgi:hypothetical protein
MMWILRDVLRYDTTLFYLYLGELHLSTGTVLGSLIKPQKFQSNWVPPICYVLSLFLFTSVLSLQGFVTYDEVVTSIWICTFTATSEQKYSRSHAQPLFWNMMNLNEIAFGRYIMAYFKGYRLMMYLVGGLYKLPEFSRNSWLQDFPQFQNPNTPYVGFICWNVNCSDCLISWLVFEQSSEMLHLLQDILIPGCGISMSLCTSFQGLECSCTWWQQLAADRSFWLSDWCWGMKTTSYSILLIIHMQIILFVA